MAAQTTGARRSRCAKRRVSWTLAAEGTTPSGRPSVEATIWYLVPALPRSVGLGPVSSPPRLARTEQLSTTTSQEVATPGPARTIRIRATWTRRSRAVAPAGPALRRSASAGSAGADRLAVFSRWDPTRRQRRLPASAPRLLMLSVFGVARLNSRYNTGRH